MFRWVLIVMCVVLLPLMAEDSDSKSTEDLRRARIITGYAPGESSEWDPLNEIDSLYLGNTWAKPGQWFLAERGEPPKVNTREDLQRVIYEMAFSLREKRKLELAAGVLPRDVREWLRCINTSVYGQFELEVQSGYYFVKATYGPEARIMAAFRNPQMEGKLEKQELETLHVCAWWIALNISRNMPNALKLQKVHDAIIDTSVYTQGKHNVTDILLKGQGSCVAYAAATQLLLHMVKIDCRKVFGTRTMNHVWNMVELNGEWYHLDVAWDDPASADPIRMYNYFLLTDAEAESDHRWDNAELYTPTPFRNRWHFSMRNHTRRSWIAGKAGYALPREEENIPAKLQNVYARQTGDLAEQLVNKLGFNVKRKEKVEDTLRVDPSKSIKDYEHQVKSGKVSRSKTFKPDDIPQRWTQYAPRFSRKSPRNEAQADGKVASPEELNEALRKFAEKLDGPRLVIPCKEDIAPWRMREIVGTSEVNKYFLRFNAIYDDVQRIITLDVDYQPEMRYVMIHGGKVPPERISKRDGEVLMFCNKYASYIMKSRSKRANADLVQGKLMCPCCSCRSLGNSRGTPEDSASAVLGLFPEKDEGSNCTPGVAQIMYVIFHIGKIPCKMVHGRDEKGPCAWNLVQIKDNEWYHYDSYSEDAKEPDHELPKHAHKGEHRQAVDSVQRKHHIWDVEEVPATPTEAQKEASLSAEKAAKSARKTIKSRSR